MPKIIKLLFHEEIRGKGTASDPIRTVPQLWTTKGALIAEYDHANEEARLGAFLSPSLGETIRMVAAEATDHCLCWAGPRDSCPRHGDDDGDADD